MKKYKTSDIRNVALVGHSGSGKTSLTEALLYLTGAIQRPGKIENGSTVSDFSKEEIDRSISISLSLLPVEWKNKKVNLLDAPGYFDFASQVLTALKTAESALMVIDASAGIEVGSEIYWNYTEKISLPRIIFLNKMDKPHVNFNERISELHQQFGKKVLPLTLTIGSGENFEGLIDIMDRKAYKYNGNKAEEISIPDGRQEEIQAAYEELVEVIAMSDDALMEKYFEGEEFTEEEVRKGMTKAITTGLAVPLIAGCASTGAGTDLLLDAITQYLPAPDNADANSGFRVLEGEAQPMDPAAPVSAAIFKTSIDPYVGKISYLKVLSGTLAKGEVYNATKKIKERPAGMFFLRGKEQIETSEIVAGDIGALSKLEKTETGDTLSDPAKPVVFKPMKLPEPTLTFAIVADSKGDEDKMSQSLAKLAQEDPTFAIENNQETKQLLISGLGNVQLESMISRLASDYDVHVHRVPLIVPYRETIRGTAEVQGRHKKQTGGAGQFGDVWVRFEPIEEGFEFAEEVFGGSVPKNYFPAVQKGLEESLESGPLAGYPVTGLRAVLYDGSYHPVDSNEMAFKLAAKLAFKNGLPKAKPVLLEPVMALKITIPDAYLGDVMGDMNKRRGRILGMEQDASGNQVVNAEAPYAEITEYAIDLRSMTQGRGSFTMEFKAYEQAPNEIAEKIIEESKKEAEE